MTDRSRKPFVGRQEQIATLQGLLPGPQDGPRIALLHGAKGSGRSTLLSRATEEPSDRLLLRWRFEPSDDGVAALLRIHAGVAVALTRGGEPAEQAVRHMREHPPENERFSAWITSFLDQLEEMKTDEDGRMELRLPKDNPFLGLLHAVAGAAAAVPMVIELHQVNAITSPAFWTWLLSLMRLIDAQGSPVLWVVSPTVSPYGEEQGETNPTPSEMLFQVLSNRVAATIELPVLQEPDILELLGERYRPNQFPDELAPRLTQLSEGNPAKLDDALSLMEGEEIIVWDEAGGFTLERAVSDITHRQLVPEPSLETEEDDNPERTKEREQQALAVLYVAALEGVEFTAGVIASTLDLERDVVDDLLDEMADVVEEIKYIESLRSWTYRFKRRTYRDFYLEAGKTKGQRSIPGRMARALLDGYVPAAQRYLPIAARLFQQVKQQRQARNLLALAMGSDRLDLSLSVIELLSLQGAEGLPDNLVRLIHAEPAERAVNGAAPETATQMLTHLHRWAEQTQDAGLAGYEQLLRSRLALRGQDLDAAVQHAEGALELFKQSGESVRSAETLNHLAMLSLHRKDPRAAMDYLDRSGRHSNIPPVKAHVQFIRGLMRRGERKFVAAAESFGLAAKTAGDAGNVLLALEARMNQGEMCIVQGRPKSAEAPLRKALETAQALRAYTMERTTTTLLAQVEAAKGNNQEAFDLARDALEISRQLGNTPAMAADLYHCGLFGAAAGQRDEALKFLSEASNAAHDKDLGLKKEIYFHIGQLRFLKGDLDDAEQALHSCCKLASEVRDNTREMRAIQALGMVEEKRGNVPAALELYREAMQGMTAPDLAGERQAIKARLDELG